MFSFVQMIEIENLVGKEKEIVSAENKAAAALDRVFVQPETPGMLSFFFIDCYAYCVICTARFIIP